MGIIGTEIALLERKAPSGAFGVYTMILSGVKKQGNTASHTRDKNNYQLLITLKVGDNDTKEKQKKRGKEKKYHM